MPLLQTSADELRAFTVESGATPDQFALTVLTKHIQSSPWIALARLAALVAADFLGLLLSACLSYLLWARLILNQPAGLYFDVLNYLALMPLVYLMAGLYPGFGLGGVETLRRLCLGTMFAFFGLAAAVFFLKLPDYYSRMTFLIALCISLTVVPAARFVMFALFDRFAWWRKPALLVGEPKWTTEMIRDLGKSNALGYRPIGILSEDTTSDSRIANQRNIDLVTEKGKSANGFRANAIFSRKAFPNPSEKILGLAYSGKLVILAQQGLDQRRLGILLQIFPRVTLIVGYSDIPIENSRLFACGGFLGLQFSNHLLLHRNRLAKRAADIVLGSTLLVLSLPIIAVCTMLVALIDGRPCFYSQKREGLNGRPVYVWKLRTMCRDGEQRLEALLASNPELKREWEQRYKLSNDPRTLPILGNFLRRSSIDELPQLWSVVIGEMSLVGPRPFPEYHLSRFPADYRRLRSQVLPGITGLWQVTARTGGDLNNQRLCDEYYIRNWSGWLDFYILARTFWALLTGARVS